MNRLFVVVAASSLSSLGASSSSAPMTCDLYVAHQMHEMVEVTPEEVFQRSRLDLHPNPCTREVVEHTVTIIRSMFMIPKWVFEILDDCYRQISDKCGSSAQLIDAIISRAGPPNTQARYLSKPYVSSLASNWIKHCLAPLDSRSFSSSSSWTFPCEFREKSSTWVMSVPSMKAYLQECIVRKQTLLAAQASLQADSMDADEGTAPTKEVDEEARFELTRDDFGTVYDTPNDAPTAEESSPTLFQVAVITLLEVNQLPMTQQVDLAAIHFANPLHLVELRTLFQQEVHGIVDFIQVPRALHVLLLQLDVSIVTNASHREAAITAAVTLLSILTVPSKLLSRHALGSQIDIWMRFCIAPLKQGDGSACGPVDPQTGALPMWQLSRDTVQRYLLYLRKFSTNPFL